MGLIQYIIIVIPYPCAAHIVFIKNILYPYIAHLHRQIFGYIIKQVAEYGFSVLLSSARPFAPRSQISRLKSINHITVARNHVFQLVNVAHYLFFLYVLSCPALFIVMKNIGKPQQYFYSLFAAIIKKAFNAVYRDIV